MSAKAHLLALRLAVVGVAIFAFCFSALFALEVDIWMWWAITGAIYSAGAGACIIGGLYWKKATAAGAWVAMSLGSLLAVSAILLDKYWTSIAPWANTHLALGLPEKIWVNSAWQSFIVLCIAGSSFVLVSLLTSKRDFDMDQLLHRGKYRIKSDHVHEILGERPTFLQRLIGVDRSFSATDKFVAGFIFWWSVFLVALCLGLVAWEYGVGAYNPALRMTNRNWATYWLIFGLAIPFAFAVITLIWFAIGGLVDLRHFFAALRSVKRDTHDDGTVENPNRP